MSDEKIVLKDGNASNEYVVEVARKAEDLIMREVMKVHKRQQWLIVSRVVSYIFQKHFVLSISKANEAIDEQEK